MRYILFGGDCQYPKGGFDDFMEKFETLEEAKIYLYNYVKEFNWTHRYNWAHIIDIETLDEVWHY